MNTGTIDVTFSKAVYANITAGTADDYNVIMRAKSSKGEEVWVPSAYDEKTYTVTFKRPAGGAPLSGDIDFTIMNARAGSGDQYQPADPETFTLSFGDLGSNRPVIFYDSESAWAEYGNQYLPVGWTIYDAAAGADGQVGNGESASGRSRMFTYANGGAFTRGFYTSPRAGSVDGRLVYGTAEGYSLYLEPGAYWLSFSAFWWDKGSWNATTTSVYVYPVGGEKGDALGSFRPDDGYGATTAQAGNLKVDIYNSYKYSFEIETAGNYVLEFFTPSSAGWSGQCIGAIELSNQYSEAFKYLLMLENAQAAANAVLTDAKAAEKYSGDYLNGFQSVIDEYEGFKDTAPSAYEAATQTIKDATSEMSNRMSVVDKYYTEYAAAEAKEAVYTDSTGYNQLEAYNALVAKIAEYKELDVTKEDNESLTAITAEVTAATKGMTDRCDAMDKFNGLKADLEGLFETYASYDFADEFKKAQTVYNENKDADLITISDDDLTAANNSMDAAKTAFNNKMSAANLLSKQDKQLKALASDLEVVLDADAQAMVDDVMATILEDDQNVANLYQLAIKARLAEMIANEELDSEVELTHFIQNASFYTTYSPSNKIHSNSDPLPGWTVLGGSNNDYLRDRSNNGADANINYEGSAKNSGIALDWNSAVKMTQTIKNLPAGKYTFNFYQNAWGTLDAGSTAGGFIFIQKDENGETVAADTITMYSGGTGEVTLLGGEVELLLDLTTRSTWGFFDDLQLTFTEPLAGYDYAADAAAAAAAIEDAKTGVAPVESAADVKYYNLSGVRTAQPEGISIKVTTGKNGARKVEKVLVK